MGSVFLYPQKIFDFKDVTNAQLSDSSQNSGPIACGPGVYTGVMTIGPYASKFICIFIATTALTVINVGFGAPGAEVSKTALTIPANWFGDIIHAPWQIPVGTRVAIHATVAVTAEMHAFRNSVTG